MRTREIHQIDTDLVTQRRRAAPLKQNRGGTGCHSTVVSALFLAAVFGSVIVYLLFDIRDLFTTSGQIGVIGTYLLSFIALHLFLRRGDRLSDPAHFHATQINLRQDDEDELEETMHEDPMFTDPTFYQVSPHNLYRMHDPQDPFNN